MEQNGENKEPAKQYSVLELLELQARARAIRSQLALEPVTKIELDDSDTEIPTETKEKEQTAEPSSQNNGNHKENKSTPPLEEETNVVKSRPVRLKRNFRQRQTEGYESDERSRSVGEVDKESVITAEQKTPERTVEKAESPKKETAPDDDVVPIIAEPEILCISSSDSENEEKKEKTKTKRSYITMPVVEKEVRPPTEDELFLLKIKEKSEAKKRSDSTVSNDPKSTDQSLETQNSDADVQKVNQEMEDGEIFDDDEIVEIPESPEAAPSQLKKDSNGNDDDKNESIEEIRETSAKGSEKDHGSESSGSESDSDESKSDESSGTESNHSEQKAASQTSKRSNIDDDDDEDIIDLGKDEDLDFEQLELETTHVEPQKEEVPTRHTRSKSKKSKSEDRISPVDSEPKVNNFFALYFSTVKIIL